MSHIPSYYKFGITHVILKTITRTRTLKGGGFGLTLTNGHVVGCYSLRKFVSYVQERAIVPEPHMGDPIEVCGHGCEEGGIHLEYYKSL